MYTFTLVKKNVHNVKKKVRDVHNVKKKVPNVHNVNKKVCNGNSSCKQGSEYHMPLTRCENIGGFLNILR